MMLLALSGVISLAVSLIAPLVVEGKSMEANERHLAVAQTNVNEFEVHLGPERLREAYVALENIYLEEETDHEARRVVRRNTLYLWLQVVQHLDRYQEPNFNPKDVPELLVQPPPTRAGVVFPPGADPALIDNPDARAEYENAIAANRSKAERYNFQTELRLVDEEVTPRVKTFIRNSYTSVPADQEELRNAILEIIKNTRRKAELKQLLAERRP